jgi:glutaredoxin-dependent peroxiredoxin
MLLSPGDPAPDFTLFDDERQPWTLSARTRPKAVLLFFPGAFTSVCTTEMNAVNYDLDRYERLGADVVGISTDSPDALAEFRKANDLRFRLLSDHDADVADAYGVRFTREEHRLGFSRIAKRASFVVDAQNRIAHAELLAHPGLQPDFDAILDALEE